MFRSRIREFIKDAAQGMAGAAMLPDFSVEVPEDPAHGDYATNAAMVIAKAAAKQPQDIAIVLKEKIKARGEDLIERAEVAGPGFVNLWISDAYLLEKFPAVLTTGGLHALENWGGKKVMVEFTDPNPFKEFHIGHLYSNIVGEALSRILEGAGASVKRANYQGDVGLHVAKAVWGMQRKLEAGGMSLAELERNTLDERIQFLGQAYAEGARAFDADESAKKEIAELNGKIFARDPQVQEWYTKGRAWSLDYFERIYQRLGTKFDFYYFERDVGEVGLALVREQLKKRVFEESEGAVVFPGEKYGLHRRVFINSEGLPTYEAKELGLAPTKYKNFPYDLSVIVTGSEIIDYFKVLIAALKEIYPSLAEKTRHVAHGMVRLAHGKMSSRTGEVMRAENLLDEVKRRALELMASSEKGTTPMNKDEIAEWVAVGAVKYSLLKVRIGQDIVFDTDTSLNLEGDSGPYLQYAHARLKSILRRREKMNNFSDRLDYSTREEEATPDAVEHQLLVSTLRLPEAMEDALKDFAPNVLANYLYSLAKLANEFYHSHPVIQEPDAAKRKLRIAIVAGVATTLKNGLGLLGIAAPEEM
ncbi:MAG: arginine--tRNA ligase [Candidatus Sungbacteria bacterium RIFCSPLOWO2_01_FULL_59_16]|uniref:Arginine--tRNA ligase n=1 Tax=Candidatus Sungbacteria bacterium RIFCSPLOWO2_01_FULL_59_16 TaxID=1802280 RepID=A0A1G2LBY4_9BACT|nr:MAG: arginine--tRNA ligase [Candidatus Sungbacteria bacterium RIFCSPLOWO2_01_FULL_59_16]